MTTISNASTHQGRVRDHNEDTFTDTLIQTPSGAYHLLLVADGMGGHARGEVASGLAAVAVREYLEYGAWHDPAEALRTAFKLANDRVHQAGGDMGTTLVAALIEEATGQYWVHNVGDSRAYLLDSGALTPLTRDHSEIALRVEAGQLTREEASHTKGRNVLLRAIGPEVEVQSDGFGPYALRPGQRLLLCSDGLHGMLSDERLAQMAWAAPLASAPEQLIAAANAAGGRDNITVVLAALAGNEVTVVEGGRPSAPPARKTPVVALIASAAACVGIAGLVGGIVVMVVRGGSEDSKASALGANTRTIAVPTAATTTPSAAKQNAPASTAGTPSAAASPAGPSPTVASPQGRSTDPTASVSEPTQPSAGSTAEPSPSPVPTLTPSASPTIPPTSAATPPPTLPTVPRVVTVAAFNRQSGHWHVEWATTPGNPAIDAFSVTITTSPSALAVTITTGGSESHADVTSNPGGDVVACVAVTPVVGGVDGTPGKLCIHKTQSGWP